MEFKNDRFLVSDININFLFISYIKKKKKIVKFRINTKRHFIVPVATFVDYVW